MWPVDGQPFNSSALIDVDLETNSRVRLFAVIAQIKVVEKSGEVFVILTKSQSDHISLLIASPTDTGKSTDLRVGSGLEPSFGVEIDL